MLEEIAGLRETVIDGALPSFAEIEWEADEASAEAARGSGPKSRHCTSARTTDSSTPWIFVNRAEWRNLAVELAFRATGLHTLRHVDTADRLRVSLRLPGGVLPGKGSPPCQRRVEPPGARPYASRSTTLDSEASAEDAVTLVDGLARREMIPCHGEE